jgi:hypothetical protein
MISIAFIDKILNFQLAIISRSEYNHFVSEMYQQMLCPFTNIFQKLAGQHFCYSILTTPDRQSHQ